MKKFSDWVDDSDILYLRRDHGGSPVLVTFDDDEVPSFHLMTSGNEATIYTGAKSFLDAVYGGEPPKTSLARYFGLTKKSLSKTEVSVLDMFGDGDVEAQVPPKPKTLAPIAVTPGKRSYVKSSRSNIAPLASNLTYVFRGSPTISERKNPESKSFGVLPKGTGIDLMLRGHEVRKLMYACFHGKIKAAKLDPEDVLQDVYRGLLVRNDGKCPWDPNKSSFGYYVYLVINGILINSFRKQERIRSNEVVGIPSMKSRDGESNVAVEVKETAWNRTSGDPTKTDSTPLPRLVDDLIDKAVKVGMKEKQTRAVVLGLLEGRSKKDIASSMGVCSRTVSNVVRKLQDIA